MKNVISIFFFVVIICILVIILILKINQLKSSERWNSNLVFDHYIIDPKKNTVDNSIMKYLIDVYPLANWTNYSFSDIKTFYNKLDLIKNMGGVVIWVQRGELPEWFDIASQAHNNVVSRKIMQTKYRDIHESEWNWAGYPVDYIIDNNGTLEDLANQVENIRDWNTGEFKSTLKLV